MFGHKKERTESNSDFKLLLESMDKVIEGNFDPIDTRAFTDGAVGEKLNNVLDAFRKSNNNFVMRANEAMQSIGDNSYVKNMLDQVESQTVTINEMQESSGNLENSINDITNSIEHIRSSSHNVLQATNDSAEGMRVSAKVVKDSTEEINNINLQIQDFQEKITKISEIIDMVKKVASQSNLLALNASIEAARAGEAGKGFAVVADQVRELSNSTSASADDVVKYVGELQTSIAELAASMDATTKKLEDGNKRVEDSIANINAMESQMNDVTDEVDSIYHAIDKQSAYTKDLSKVIGQITDSYSVLSQDCHDTGEHIYKIGRYIDTLRSDMFRGFSDVTLLDRMKIFSIDHFILTWRVYNNAVGFESLKLTQLNNATGPNACKFGKWAQSVTDTKITSSSQFKDMVQCHNDIHNNASESWKAKDAGNTELAIEYFNKALEAYYRFDESVKRMMDFMRANGEKDMTQIVVFRK